MSEDQPSRIAIKFAAKTNAANPSKRNAASPARPPSTLGKRHRPGAQLGVGSDSEGDPDTGRHAGKHEAITGFGADGAEIGGDGPKAKAELLVIGRLPDQGWRAQMKRRREHQREERIRRDGRAQRDAAENPETEEPGNVQWGLVTNRSGGNDGGPAEPPRPDSPQPPDRDGQPDAEPQPRSADDEAMDALLDRRSHHAVIRVSEDEAFSRDAGRAADVSTLEEYEHMPVEEFGEAMLRGMGWNGDLGPKARQVKQRPHGLGLGAKELKEAEDLGDWNHKAGSGSHKRSRPRLDEYRREEAKRREQRGRGEDSYKRERERERDQTRAGDSRGHGEGDRDRERGLDGDRHGRDGDRRHRDRR